MKSMDKKNRHLLNRTDIAPDCQMEIPALGGRGDAMSGKLSSE